MTHKQQPYQYENGVNEARIYFRDVLKEEITPYTELSWGLSRVIGVDPKLHIPASRWHNALCCVQAAQVMDYALWSKAVLRLHLDQMKTACSQTCYYESTYGYLARATTDIVCATELFIDRSIKGSYPKVRRNTKRWLSLASSVREKAERIIRYQAIETAKSELSIATDRLKQAEAKAAKIRAQIEDFEQASWWVIKLCPEATEQIDTATREMRAVLKIVAHGHTRQFADVRNAIEAYIANLESKGGDEANDRCSESGSAVSG